VGLIGTSISDAVWWRVGSGGEIGESIKTPSFLDWTLPLAYQEHDTPQLNSFD